MAKTADLKKQILMEGFSKEELTIISKNVETKSFAKGDYIFKEDDPTLGIYMIKSGKVEIKRDLEMDTKTKMLIMLRNIRSSEIRHTHHGWEHIFASFDDGNFFGELSIIEERKTHSAEAIAIKDTDLFLLRKEKFKKLEKTNPDIMAKIMRSIAKIASKNVRLLHERMFKALIGK